MSLTSKQNRIILKEGDDSMLLTTIATLFCYEPDEPFPTKGEVLWMLFCLLLGIVVLLNK